MWTSLKLLLSSIVDYAGLFPPAQLSLAEAVTEYNLAQASPHTWMLDRFVIPVDCLPELGKRLSIFSRKTSSCQCWSVSVILSKNWAGELKQIDQISEQISEFFNKQKYERIDEALFQFTDYIPDYIHIRALEVAPLPPDEIRQVCLHLPADVDVFFEIPFNADLEPYLPVLQQTGTAAKLRTGGVTTNVFPDNRQLGQRILSLAAAQIPFKATAGLHHALRGNYRLTYQPDSTSTTMQGFLNLAVLAAFADRQHINLTEAIAILEERSIAAFQFTDTEMHWHNHALSIADIEQSRHRFFRSFGSCSFQELINDLYHLELL